MWRSWPSPGWPAQGADIVQLIGARRRDQLTEALGALKVELTSDDLAAIERAVPKGSAAAQAPCRKAVRPNVPGGLIAVT